MASIQEALDRRNSWLDTANNDNNNLVGEGSNDTTAERYPHKTIVIMMGGGRLGNPSARLDECTWRFNRVAAEAAHRQGFAVFDREELERRLLFKSETVDSAKYMKSSLHLDAPGPQIVATALLGLISCLTKDQIFPTGQLDPFHIFKK